MLKLIYDMAVYWGDTIVNNLGAVLITIIFVIVMNIILVCVVRREEAAEKKHKNKFFHQYMDGLSEKSIKIYKQDKRK